MRKKRDEYWGKMKGKRKFDVKLRKVGNSFVTTIPADFIERFELEEGDFLAIEVDVNDIKKQNKKLKEIKDEKRK